MKYITGEKKTLDFISLQYFVFLQILMFRLVIDID